MILFPKIYRLLIIIFLYKYLKFIFNWIIVSRKILCQYSLFPFPFPNFRCLIWWDNDRSSKNNGRKITDPIREVLLLCVFQLKELYGYILAVGLNIDIIVLTTFQVNFRLSLEREKERKNKEKEREWNGGKTYCEQDSNCRFYLFLFEEIDLECVLESADWENRLTMNITFINFSGISVGTFMTFLFL